MTYLDVALNLVVLMAPVTVVMALILWWLHAQDRKRDTRLPLPRLRLSLVLAIEATITAVGSAYLATATALFRFGHPLPVSWAPVSVTVIFALELVPGLSALYLLWLRGKED